MTEAAGGAFLISSLVSRQLPRSNWQRFSWRHHQNRWRYRGRRGPYGWWCWYAKFLHSSIPAIHVQLPLNRFWQSPAWRIRRAKPVGLSPPLPTCIPFPNRQQAYWYARLQSPDLEKQSAIPPRALAAPSMTPPTLPPNLLAAKSKRDKTP